MRFEEPNFPIQFPAEEVESQEISPEETKVFDLSPDLSPPQALVQLEEREKELQGQGYEQFTEEDEQLVRTLLEQAMPGCVDYCERECNVSHFARYPHNVLMDMYKNRTGGHQWGVMFVAKDDHNGAFYHQKALHDMHQEIGSKVMTRIVEIGSIQDARKYSARLAAEHSEAAFAIV